MKSCLLNLLMIISLSFITTSISLGSILLVPDDYQKIQEAIDAAVDGDTVLVGDGLYKGEGNTDIKFKGKAITVKSSDGSENCIIDGEDKYHGFVFANQEGKNSVLSGFTIQNSGQGYMDFDVNTAIYGAITCAKDSSPTIENCIIFNNRTGINNTGIYLNGSSPDIINCTISENQAQSWGGGIYCTENSSPLIQGCIISHNNANNGGGIYIDGSPTIVDSTISQNSNRDRVSYGAGIYIKKGSPNISNCVIDGNTGKNKGGGIYIHEADDVTISDSKITNNSLDYSTSVSGAGIFIYLKTKSVQLIDCIIDSNSASGDDSGAWGAGIYNHSSNIFFKGCIVSNNIAHSKNDSSIGGGIWSSGMTEIINCIITNNKATGYRYSSAGGIAGYNEIVIVSSTIADNISDGGSGLNIGSSTIAVIANSIIWDNELYIPSSSEDIAEISYSDIQDRHEGTGNFSLDPKFVGGNDYHLTVQSPCIDAGTFVASRGNTDIDGDVIPICNGFDVGADEYPGCGQHIGQPPVANAGTDITADSGDIVTLDGSESYDPEGGLISYTWEIIDGPSVELSDTNVMNPSFNCPENEYRPITFGLTVTDRDDMKGTDTVIVNMSYDNLEPEAELSCPERINEGEEITIDASNSYDTDGTIVSYSWETRIDRYQTEGEYTPVANEASSTLSFTAPMTDADPISVLYMLTVEDDGGKQDTKSCRMEVIDTDGSGSDSDGGGGCFIINLRY